MIINNKENNKGEQHPHIPNEHPTRHSPPSEEVEGDFSSVRHSPPFGGVGGGFNSLPPEALGEVSSARHIPSFGGAWGGFHST